MAAKSYTKVIRDSDLVFFDESQITLIKIQGDTPSRTAW